MSRVLQTGFQSCRCRSPPRRSPINRKTERGLKRLSRRQNGHEITFPFATVEQRGKFWPREKGKPAERRITRFPLSLSLSLHPPSLSLSHGRAASTHRRCEIPLNSSHDFRVRTGFKGARPFKASRFLISNRAPAASVAD